MEEFPPTGLVDPDAFRRKTSNQRLPKIFSIEGIRVKEKKKKLHFLNGSKNKINLGVQFKAVVGDLTITKNNVCESQSLFYVLIFC